MRSSSHGTVLAAFIVMAVPTSVADIAALMLDR